MRMSTIAKQAAAGSGSQFSRILGSEVRRRRMALGLSQASVGRPLTRAFMSSLENGRVIPSLPSLLMIARRLNTSCADILRSVESQMEGDITDGTCDEAAIPR